MPAPASTSSSSGLIPRKATSQTSLGADDEREELVDNLVRHLIRRPNGDFADLIRQAEGFDIIPEHNMLGNLPNFLRRKKEQAENLSEAFRMNTQLLRVLQDADVNDEYDVFIVDPPATEDRHLYNAVAATRSLVIPVELSAKG